MHRSFLFSFMFGIIGGISLAEVWAGPALAVPVGALVGLAAIHWYRLRVPALIMLGLCIGIWRWQTAINPIARQAAVSIGHSATFTGDIVRLPEYGQQQLLLLELSQYGGRLQVYAPPYPRYDVGQRLTVRCQPESWPETSRVRQWSHGIQARCFNASVIRTAASPRSLRLRLSEIESAVVGFIHRNFNEPQASLLAGIILGSQSGMPDELIQDFQATGTTHIIALSGFNVTIIVSSVMVVLVRVVGRRWAWLPGLALVILFVVMTGASASVVRAAIMAVIAQLAIFLGRPVHPARLLSYTAVVMLWQNPLILWHDLGFQLSFLATIGLMFMSKPLAERLPFIPAAMGLRDNLATTLAAIIVTEPLLLWRFGRLSLIAPVVNILVLPLIPLAMGLGTLSLIGLAVPWLAGPVLAITDAVLRLVLIVITQAAALPWSLVYLPAAATAVSGLVFAGWSFRLLRRDHAPENLPA